VFTYLAEICALVDIAFAGADSTPACGRPRLISPARAAALLPCFCAEVACPPTAD